MNPITPPIVLIGMAVALHSFTYVSRAAPWLSQDDLARIHRSAIERNQADGVTGLLVFDGVAFMQIVEGEHAALAALLARLASDNRHGELSVVDERQIDARSFGDWSMKLVEVSRARLQGIEDIEHELGPHILPEIHALLMGTVMLMRELS